MENPNPLDELTVLFVCDEESLGKTTVKHLKKADPLISLHTEKSGKVLETLQSGEIDCILSDYHLSQLNGLDLAREVRRISDTPFILYVDRSSNVAEDAFREGVSDYVTRRSGFAHYQRLARRIRRVVGSSRTIHLYRDIAEGSKDGVVITVGSTAVFVNPSASKLVGAKSPKDAIGKDLLNYVLEEDRQKLVEMILGSTDEKLSKLRPMEIVLRRIDGALVNVEAATSFIRYMGQPAFLTFLRDTTTQVAYTKGLRVLHNYALRLNKSKSSDEALKLTLDAMVNLLGFKRCSIGKVVDGYVREYMVQGEADSERLNLTLSGLGLITKAVRLKKTVVVQDTLSDPEYLPVMKGIDVRSKMVVPVIVDDVVVAVLSVERNEVDAFLEAEVELLEILASHLSQSIGIIEKMNEREAIGEVYKLLEKP